MKCHALAFSAALFATANAFVQNAPKAFVPATVQNKAITSLAMAEAVFDQEQFNAEGKEMRLKYLEEQAMYALKISCENYGNAVFPNAMIAGDVVITHLLNRLGYFNDGKVTIMCVDTFHLFPETMEFLKEIEGHYGFEAKVFCAEGVPVGDKAAFDTKYGADLWKEDIEQYDKVCKVEPFQRGLKECKTDCMINGRPFLVFLVFWVEVYHCNDRRMTYLIVLQNCIAFLWWSSKLSDA